MNIPDIDFTRIRSLGPGGQRDAYEQLICELVAQEKPTAHSRFVSLHGAGGDGGVECYWTLPDGTEHGWQAKYWTTHSKVDKSQLDTSVKAALTQHPNLTHYTIAIPADPTGPTGSKGKSLLEKLYEPDGWLEEWKAIAADRNITVTFELEWATNTITRLTRLDSSGIQRRYWFDADVLPLPWWTDRLDAAIAAARPRYTPELNVVVPAGLSIAALCSDNEWWHVVESQLDALQAASDELRHASDVAQAADLDTASSATSAAVGAITDWKGAQTGASFQSLNDAIKNAAAVTSTQEALEVEALDATYEHWDTPGWRQHQSEYFVDFPAGAVDALRHLLKELSKTSELVTGSTGRLVSSQVALMTGPAGIGKTYLALDAAVQRLEQGRLSIMLHGRWFNNNDPLDRLRDLLHMPTDLTSEETIALLSQSATVAGSPVLLIIDALNDTRPRSTWRDNLERLITMVERYSNVRLLLTARTHYVGQILPPGVSIERFAHSGFQGVEFEAVSEYASFYRLEPPTSPPIHGEFDNPLYLRLVCEALQSDNRLSLDQANMGLDQLTKLILGHANSTVSDRIDASPSDLVVQRAMHALASALADQPTNTLTRINAQRALVHIWTDVSAEKSLLDALIAQGLIEEDVTPDGTPYGVDVITITFERIGHHLIVTDALADARSAEDVRDALSGRLGSLIGLNEIIDVGLLEAVSVVVAERLGLELTCFAAEISDSAALDAAVIAGTAWRPASSITLETGHIITNALRDSRTFNAGLTMLFRLAARPEHALNADFLNGFLGGLTMSTRDNFLAWWLHKTHGTHGAVDRLVRWGSDRPLDQVSAETTRLWATALIWATSATDRRVRDPATIAAARLIAQHPQQAAALLGTFKDVDDEWVLERALEVAYSALLRAGTVNDWVTSASFVWGAFFADPSQLTSNVAVRDAARSILEAAHDRGALSGDATPDGFRPPYHSQWPVNWPTVEEVAPYADEHSFPKLVHSTTADDFFTYQLKYELNDREGINPQAGARWVVTEIMRLGYRTHLHANFDRYVLHKYGQGRGKPKWIERIGKKYQWIALNRLLGHLSDHAPKERPSWEPPPPPTPGPATTIARQLDPTVTDFVSADTAPRAWVPTYDWEAKSGKTDAQWIASDADLPSIDVRNADRRGGAFVVLSGAYTWDNVDANMKRTHGVWTNLNSHLVDTDNLSTALSELEGCDLTSRSNISQLPGSRDGYVGEWPFGYHHLMTLHDVEYEWTDPLSVPTRPAVWELSAEYEYAPDDLGNISYDAPTPEFFGPEPGTLHWNGSNGWVDSDGLLVVVLRHSVNAKDNELLIDSAFLEAWLANAHKSIIWVEVTGKDVYGGLGWAASYPGALMRSQVRAWTPGNDVVTITEGWKRIPAGGA